MTAAALDAAGPDARALAHRGRTTVADRVVVKVAQHAAEQIDGTGGVRRRKLGVPLSSDRHADVATDIDGDLVVVRVRLAVQWPHPVRTVARQVREHITSEVYRITGREVAEVDVSVPRLLVSGEPENERREVH